MVRIINTSSLEGSSSDYYDTSVDGLAFVPDTQAVDTPSENSVARSRRKKRKASTPRSVETPNVSKIPLPFTSARVEIGVTPKEQDLA